MILQENVRYLSDCCRVAVENIPKEDVDNFVNLLMRYDKIFIYGSGRSGLVGQLFAVRLVQMGFDVFFIGDMTTPIIGKNDLTILISNTGDTISVVRTADIARRIGSHVISITATPTSKLAHISSSKIILDIRKDDNSMEMAPLGTIFEDSVLLFLDSLVPVLMKKMSVSEDDMRKNHAIWV